jgi:hypothetical protein
MNQHQNNKNDSYNKVNIAPFVACHGQQRLNLLSASSAVKLPAASACAGRQDRLDNNAGTNQTEQSYKTKQIDNEIQRSSLHKSSCQYKVSSFPKKISGDIKNVTAKNLYSYNANQTKLFVFIP